MLKSQYSDIPGLYVFTNYFSFTQCDSLVTEILALYQRLEKNAASLEKVNIPQPKFVRSAKHNLLSEEFFTRIVLSEKNQREIHCEYFPRYGEDGHALGYFRKTSNLPDFILGDTLSSIQKTVADLMLSDGKKTLAWKLTVNFYKAIDGVVAGFPFHVDIPANGVVTMIVNVQREALFQIEKDESKVDITLPVGALLILSGESRYIWKHRVLPMASDDVFESNDIERVSLVLGYQ